MAKLQMDSAELEQLQNVVDRLVKDANAKVVFLVDKNGQRLAISGDVDNPKATNLAALASGSAAGASGTAKSLQEEESATQVHEGDKESFHLQLVGNRAILAVVFDSKSSLGLVRLRVRKASEELAHIFETFLKKVEKPGSDSPLGELSDEDIDNLFKG